MKDNHKILVQILLDIGIVESQITDNAHLLYDLGLDSLDMAELVMLLESKLEITIKNSDWEKLNTFKDIVTYLEEKQTKVSKSDYI